MDDLTGFHESVNRLVRVFTRGELIATIKARSIGSFPHERNRDGVLYQKSGEDEADDARKSGPSNNEADVSLNGIEQTPWIKREFESGFVFVREIIITESRAWLGIFPWLLS